MSANPSRHLPGWLADAVVLALAAACLFAWLGLPPLRDNNEALYADIGWTMAHGGSWIIPHLNGVPYIEKPPLLYWLIALSYKAFGTGLWQPRLPTAAAAWLSCALLLVWGRSVGAPLAGRFAALVCATALGYVLIARTILFDPLLVLFWLAAFALVQRAVWLRRRAWLRAATLPLALAVLTKGPEALLLLGLIALLRLLLAPGDWRRGELLRFYLDPVAIALLLALLVPWHVAATLQQHGFAWFYFINETVMRFLGRRIPDDFHTGPWWYYGPKLLIGFFQWSPLLALLAWRAPRLGSTIADDAARWARDAAVVLTVFFSIASNKGAYYLLPVVPLAALWLGVRLQRAADAGVLDALGRQLSPAALAFGVAAFALWGASLAGPLHDELLRSGLPPAQFAWLPWLIGALALIALLAATLLMHEHTGAGLIVYALTGLAMVAFATELDIAKTADTSQAEVAATLHRVMPADAEVFSWQTFEDHDASLLMYGWRPLRVIDSTSADLWFGCRALGAAGPCVGPQALRQARHDGRAVAVWVARSRLQGFFASGLQQGLQALPFKDSVVFITPISRPAKQNSAPTLEIGAAARSCAGTLKDCLSNPSDRRFP